MEGGNGSQGAGSPERNGRDGSVSAGGADVSGGGARPADSGPDATAGGIAIPGPGYLGEPPPLMREADLSAIEAILRSPIEHTPQAQEGPRDPQDANGLAEAGGLPSANRPVGGVTDWRTALLKPAPDSQTRTDSGFLPEPHPASRAHRAFQRFHRVSDHPARTAFLASPALGARPPRRGETRAEGPGSQPGQSNSGLSPQESALHGDELAGTLDVVHKDEPLLTKEEIDAFFATPLTESLESVDDEENSSPHIGDLEVDQERSLHEPEATPAAPRPPWLKNQVADLADIVQALDLQARAHHAHVGIAPELARLRQFTKTMGLVAAPPQRGSQDVDMATLTEEALGALAGATPNAPRILFRRRGQEHTTVGDKSLVACALDAVLQTAVACSASGDVVRVTVDGADAASTPSGSRHMTVEVEFPEGPLAALHPSEITTPYALRKILPDIGANALAAAGAIAVGQGGDLHLLRDEDAGALVFTLELPTD